jgi:hypothetical protein
MVKNHMSYTTNLLTTTFRWRPFKAPSGGVHARVDERSTRRAVLMKDLDAEWLQALESADYSHLDDKAVKQSG